MKQTRAELLETMKAALITIMLDIAEDLAADHVDELPDEEFTSEEERGAAVDFLARDVLEAATVEMDLRFKDGLLWEEIREKYPRQPFVL